MKKRTYLPRRWALTCGNLEKLLSLPVADSLGVNVNESEREQSGIIPRQFCGARRVRAIFRGALMPFVTRNAEYIAIAKRDKDALRVRLGVPVSSPSPIN